MSLRRGTSEVGSDGSDGLGQYKIWEISSAQSSEARAVVASYVYFSKENIDHFVIVLLIFMIVR